MCVWWRRKMSKVQTLVQVSYDWKVIATIHFKSFHAINSKVYLLTIGGNLVTYQHFKLRFWSVGDKFGFCNELIETAVIFHSYNLILAISYLLFVTWDLLSDTFDLWLFITCNEKFLALVLRVPSFQLWTWREMSKLKKLIKDKYIIGIVMFHHLFLHLIFPVNHQAQ